MNRKFLLIILLLVVLVFLFLIFRAKSPEVSPLANPSSTNAKSSIDLGKPVTVDGWLTCLPSNIVDSSCVIGLQNSQGQNYGLVSLTGSKLDPTQFSTGSHYSAVGTLVSAPDFLQNYSLTGTIQLSQ